MAPQQGQRSGRKGPVWSRIRRSGQDHRPALSWQEIVTTAIEIADTEGLAALSMRRIAERLGVGTMSLYRHVPDKDDLLDLMVDEVYGMIELPEGTGGDWREALTTIAVQTRAVLRRHPWFGSAAASRSPLGPNALRHLEYTLAALDGHGLRLADIARMAGATTSYVTGFVALELAAEEEQRRDGLTEEEWAASIQPYVEKLVASGRYPTFSRLAEQEDDESEPDQDFLFGLECLLDGFAARIAAAG